MGKNRAVEDTIGLPCSEGFSEVEEPGMKE